jgi:hypothetical protein
VRLNIFIKTSSKTGGKTASMVYENNYSRGNDYLTAHNVIIILSHSCQKSFGEGTLKRLHTAGS